MAEEKKKSPIAQREEEILKSWKEKDVFNKTLAKESPEGEFVFYEGPPTANGRPGIHHLEARAFKDAIPRYKTMRGFHVRRKGGWDTHGLPVELEVEKQLGLKSKKEIEEYGVEKFNEHCKESVWKYVNEWEEFTDRMGYWVNLDDPYITYKSEYIESLWNVLKNVHEQNLLYKDYKVVPWCPRCGTALSSHELAQGYETVKDLSVYVKFKAVDSDEYFLAWTTTPWTLPGNVALAVGENIEYVKVDSEGETVIMAKDRLEYVAPDAEIKEEFKGKDLIGRTYEPLYPFLKNNLPEDQKGNLENAFKIYAADFVTTEDGSGIVHTAVMYGQDDFVLGTEVGLPKHHLVTPDGTFVPETDFLAGRFVRDEGVAVDVIKDLAHRGLLLKKEKYEHTYPFCWRCKTPLIYYARDSWYIKMSDIKDKLIAENSEINWEPDYIKNGRFGEWLKDLKDWAISRERYWGTPLPIWMSEDGSEMEVIGSVDDLKRVSGTTNTFYITRHGESQSNVKGIVTESLDPENNLTAKGREQAQKAAEELKDKNISLIYTSPLQRTKETAEIIATVLGIEVVVDERLREQEVGVYEGRDIKEYGAFFENGLERMTKSVPDAETYHATKTRVTEFLYEINKKHQNKNILFVGHKGTMVMQQCGALGLNDKQSGEAIDDGRFSLSNAEVRKMEFTPLPHNEHFELDLHKPFVDEIIYEKNGKKMKRVSEVMDVWFDSGAMPFAQDHYPFENKERIEGSGYPADFICEAIDQTRGWFYTLHAVGALMGKGKAYKNVISLGHILDEQGQKMSKSKGNTVNPWEAMDKYGVDALRFWMYSINQPGEPKNFDEKTVDEIVKKVFNLLLNVVTFYEMAGVEAEPKNDSKHVLDRWLIARFNSLHKTVTENLDNYKLLESSRAIREFIGDLSQWYIRRSRDRFRDGDADALGTTRFVLLELSKLMAPFMPFLAEDVYGKMGGEKANAPEAHARSSEAGFRESVHLENWPEGGKIDEELLEQMTEARNVVTEALEARAKANVKVRQPLVRLVIGTVLSDELLEVIAEEVNVKEVVSGDELSLDTEITPELQKEGDMRELLRAVQGMRKDAGLNPDDEIVLVVETENKDFIEEFKNEFKRVANVMEFDFSSEHTAESKRFELSSGTFKISIK